MDLMENPFIYGAIVTGKHFVDREKEIKELTMDLLSGQHVILYSPRKMGKSSLIEEIFRKINDQGKAIAVRINLQSVITKEDMARMMINEIVKNAYSSIEKAAKEIKDFFTKISVRIFIDEKGRMGIEPIFRNKEDLLEEVLAFPEKKGKKKRIIIAFDEFQEIEKFDGLGMERRMRAIMENHKNVSYLFSGSERHLISLIFENEERPFYRFGKMVRLEPVERKKLEKFVIERFEETGKKINREATNFVLAFSEGIPFYVQAICHEVWNLGNKIDLKKAKRALDEVISSFSPGFELIWNNIGSEYQKKLLVIMAGRDKDFELNTEFIEKHGLKSFAHIRKAIQSLEKRGMIYKNRIADFFFREWIKREKVVWNR
ncbi:MAG: ATP-binding protein [Candidatus Thermoplasmatota archaeon]|nr:ATP-binding protein [Candidatus Thermoplasmatota archaeon]